MRAWTLKIFLLSLVFRQGLDLSCKETEIIVSEEIRLKPNHLGICLKYVLVSIAPQDVIKNFLVLQVATWLVEFIFEYIQ